MGETTNEDGMSAADRLVRDIRQMPWSTDRDCLVADVLYGRYEERDPWPGLYPRLQGLGYEEIAESLLEGYYREGGETDD